jgi:hypothetical protein
MDDHKGHHPDSWGADPDHGGSVRGIRAERRDYHYGARDVWNRREFSRGGNPWWLYREVFWLVTTFWVWIVTALYFAGVIK